MNHGSSHTSRHLLCLALLAAFAGPAAAQIVIPPVPLSAGQSNPPLVMIVAGKDHKQFYEAYNDTLDLNGDGKYDVRFDPNIEYYGLFDSNLCYTSGGSGSSDYFSPVAAVLDMKRKNCTRSKKYWSGNFLNYITTTRIDALRKVLYGGHRISDTATETILRQVYIPRDAHAWGKEYTSTAVDGYDITEYANLPQPDTGKRHFLGSYTAPLSCATASSCRNSIPLLAIAKNAAVGKRVWDWAATERTYLFDNSKDTGVNATSEKYTVRVKVCGTAFTLPDDTKNYRGDNCKPYTNAKGVVVYKPTGLLHKFGEDGSMLFGLLTGSYDNNTSGGRLRKVMSPFSNEIDPLTGQFTANATIVKSFDNMMIRGYNAASDNKEYKNFISGSAWVGDRVMQQGEFPDWGNPVGEMMFEAMRYLGGQGSATAAFTDKGTAIDAAVGLPTASWDKPYTSTSAAKAPWCSKPNILVLSDINPSFDSDQLPGAKFNSCTVGVSSQLTNSAACTKPNGTSFSGSFESLDVGTLADLIGEKEGVNNRDFFIGQSGTVTNWAPTAKRINTLSTVRGLAPEEPGKEGSYYSAAVAYYGKATGITTAAGKEKQKVDTYVVALASPLPKIEVPTKKGTITIIPFGKSTKWESTGRIDASKDKFQPANQIVEFYIKEINPKDPENGNRYRATFLISYEDMEQGADHDMDVIAEYVVTQRDNDDVEVKVTPLYQSAGITLNVGYIVSGAGAQDGPYIVAQSRNDSSPAYYLNVPDGKPVGWCNDTSNASTCAKIPSCTTGAFGACNLNQKSTRVFTPAADANAATLLKDPLWYAAKWGGFRDRSSDSRHWPDVTAKWDGDGDGTPDNYFLVRNALGLQQALERAFNAIKEGVISSGNVDTSSDTFGATDTLAFRTQYSPLDWSGNLIATKLIQSSDTNPDGVGPELWRAAETLPAASSRRIYTRSDAGFANIASTGVKFAWDNLNAIQKTTLLDNNVLNFVRGDISNEIARGGSFRDRVRVGGSQSPFSDSPNNSPLYVKDTHTVYLGTNDGMLHAFDAANGKELFAYIPSALIPKLARLTHPHYTHEHYVDGEVAVTTEQEAGGNFLVGALGRGGKGLYGLDVSAPASFSESHVKWEINGPPELTQCGTSPAHDNMGLVLGKPVIAKLNDGKVYAIVGNGYNSCYGKAVLYIVDVKTGAVAKMLETPIIGNNGLSSPGVLDSNNDQKVDYVYAGDLQGNLWRFDLSSSKPADWAVDLRKPNSKPLFTAKNASNQVQPITAAPVAAVDFGNGTEAPRTFVFFGTGRYLSNSDKGDTTVQSWYGLIDDDDTSITRNELVKRKFEATGTLPNGKQVRAIESQANAGDMDGKFGWYIDFDVKTDVGERVVSPALLVRAVNGTVVQLPSIIPIDNDPCVSGGRGYINFVNAFTGARVTFAFMDINGDGVVNGDDKMAGDRLPSSVGQQSGMPGNIKLVGDQNINADTNSTLGSTKVELGGSKYKHKGRVSWREIHLD